MFQRSIRERNKFTSVLQNNSKTEQKYDRLADVDGKRDADGLRKFYEGERHETLMRLARLEKLLGMKRRCKHCGNDL